MEQHVVIEPQVFDQHHVDAPPHAAQIDPEGWWFACPIELQQQCWPTEDFELARTLVNSPTPEDDLFAGIRGTLWEQR